MRKSPLPRGFLELFSRCFVANPHRVLVELREAIRDTLELFHDRGARIRMLVLNYVLEARPEVHRLIANLNLYGNHARPPLKEDIHGHNQVKATIPVRFRLGDVVVLLDYRKSRYSREHIMDDEDVIFEVRNDAHSSNVLQASQPVDRSVAELSLTLLDCRIEGLDAARHNAERIAIISKRHLLAKILNTCKYIA